MKTITIERQILGKICTVCFGKGIRLYGSTATWHGGIGGAAMREDVCDKCWGSGDEEHPWTDLQKAEQNKEKEIARRAGRFLTEALGGDHDVYKPAIKEIAEDIEKLSYPTSPKAKYYASLTMSLSRALNEMIESTNKRVDCVRHELKEPATDVKLTVNVGDEVAITLAELSGAGYLWEVLATTPHVTCTRESVDKKPECEQIGGPNPTRFLLSAASVGLATVTLVHRRPWSKKDEIARRTIILTIV